MTDTHPDTNLLFGLLAFQHGLIGEDALLDGLRAWAAEKARPLAEHLQRRGALTDTGRALVESLLAERLAQHGGDTEGCLSSLPIPATLRSSAVRIARSAPADPDATETPATAPHEPPGPAAGPAGGGASRYRRLVLHAEGGLGRVYVAQDDELRREVALKEIKEAYADNASSRARFLLEAEITGALEHPGIVPIYGMGAYPDGRPYYAMRFIHGESLHDAAARCHADGPCDFRAAPLELRRLLTRFVAVCDAVAYAHQKGVIHRDLKPANVMLGEYGETLVVDWGLARRVGTATPSAGDSAEGAGTRWGAVVGTPAYMPPEQASGRVDELGPAADVYSLGATLYHLLTGAAPFSSKDGDILVRVQEGRYRPAAEANRSVSPALAAICHKAMARLPAGRYATARELAADVERWLADEEVTAHRDPPLQRLWRWARKNRSRAAAIAAAVAVALTAAVAGVMVWSAREGEKTARLQAEREGTLRSEAETQKGIADEARGRAEAAEARGRRLLYIRRMSLAERAMRESQWDRLRRLLDEGEGGEDLRGWEWYHLDAQARRQIRAVNVGPGPVRALAASPDGESFASADNDGKVALWSADGKRVRAFSGHEGVVTGLAFGPDGRTLYGGGVDGAVIAWAADTGKEVRRMAGGAPGFKFLTLAVSPDGKWVAAGREALHGVSLWNAATGERRWHSRSPAPVYALAFDAGSTQLAQGSLGVVALIDVATGKSAVELKTGMARTHGVCFGHDGEVAGACSDSVVRLWDPDSGEEKQAFKGHDGLAQAVHFTSDGATLISAGKDGTIRVWRRAGGEALTLQAKAGAVSALVPLPGGRALSGHADGSVRLWRVTPGQAAASLNVSKGRAVWSAAFHPTSGAIAAAAEDGRVVIFDGGTLAPARVIAAHKDRARAALGGRLLATAGHDHAVRLWDAATGKHVRDVAGHEAEVEALAVSEDGALLATADWSGRVQVTDAATGKPLWAGARHDGKILALAFTPDGATLAATAGGAVKTFDARTGGARSEWAAHDPNVSSLAYTPDGRAVTGGHDGVAVVWAAPGKEAVRLTGHTDWVEGVAVTPDGQRVVTCSRDGTARVWDAVTGQELLSLVGHVERVTAVAVRGDGRRIATAGQDGSVNLWDAPRP